jgi:hypothetical protein
MPVTRKVNDMPILDKSQNPPAQESINVRYVDSSNVEWVGWPASSPGPLMLVKFRSGPTVYGYVGVTRQRAVAAAYHASVGKYINERIKPNYQVVKIR